MKKMTLLNRILAVALTLAFMLSMPGMSAIAEAADNSKSESKDLKDFLSAVTITDADGNSIGKTGKPLADGENYKIHLEFSEKGAQSIQLSTEGTLTYQIPTQLKIKDHSDKPLNIKIKGSDGGEEEVTIGKYSVDENGLLTVELNDEGRSKLAEMNNAVLSFDMEATADVTHGSSSGSVDFGDVGEGFTFEITDQPRVKIEKDGVYTENADKKTGGTLSYTVKVTVEHGELNDATLNDVLTPPQNSAFSLSDPKDVEVTLKRSGDPDEHTLTVDDYELTETEGDTNHPGDKAFRIKIKEESAYAPLKEGDELCFTYTYDVNVSNPNLHLWANMENVATFTGTMPVKDPGDPNKVENISVEEEANDSCEVRMSPDGHGVICKDQSYSEATKTLHYTCYTVVPKGTWTPLQIYDDMYVQYNGEKWYLKEFTTNGKVKNLTVKAVDVEKWFGDDDWADNTPAPDKIKSFSELAEKAKVLTGYSYGGWGAGPKGYDPTSLENYLYYFADKSLYIIFGDAKKEWGEWGSWDYNKDRLIITEYDLDMSSTEPMTLYDIDDEGNEVKRLELTPEKVLKAGITNNVSLRYGGYFPGYSVFFNNADDMIKTGELNKADGTIDYTVTINTTDSTVRQYFHDVATEWYGLGVPNGWNFDDMYRQSMQAVFYDELPEGWEYVDGSLYAVASGQNNNKQEFHKINCDSQLDKYKDIPLDEDNNICVPLTVFQDDIGVNGNIELNNWFIGSEMTSLEFHYQLKATPDWLKAHATANEPVPVNNHAEIKDKDNKHWSADKTIEYYPAKLTKKAEVVDDNGDLLEFTLTINPEGADLDPNSETLNVVDKSENLEIVKSSIYVKNTKTNKKVDVTVKTETVKAEDGSGEKLQLTIVVPDGVPLDITYEARIPKKGVGIQVSNSAGIEGVAQSDDGYSSLLNVDHIAQSGSGSAFDMTVKKVDADTKAPLAGATFKLYIELKEGSVLPEDTSNPIQGYRVSYIDDYTTGEDGTAHINSDKLGPDNWYFLVETNAPEGYEKLDKPIRFYYGLRDDTTSREDIAVNPYGTLEVPNTPALGSLTVEKVVKGDGGDPNKDFHFTVTLSDTSINSTYGDMTFENGVAEFTLKHSESKTATGLPVGITYTVTEAEANQDNYETTYEITDSSISENNKDYVPKLTQTGSINVGEAAVVTVTNTFKTGGLEIEKVVTLNGEEDPSDETEFTFTLKLDNEKINGEYGEYADDESAEHKKIAFTNGEATFTLKHGQRVIFSDLPDGTVYTLTEVNNPNYLETSAMTGTVRCSADGRPETLTVTNVRKTGGLEIEKVVTLNGEKDESDKTEFGFTLTLDNSEISGEYGDVKFENGIASFTLKQGETVKIDGIPNGTGYTLTEDPNSDYREAGKISGVINHYTDKKPDKLTVTNVKATGDLTVKKTVDGGAEDTSGKEYTFVVAAAKVGQVPNGTYGDMTFTDGAATFTLKDGESKTAKGLPIGTYNVAEKNANVDGWNLEVTGNGLATARVEFDSSETVEFVNKYTMPTSAIPEVEKEVKGEVKEGTQFNFRLKDGEGTVIDEVQTNGAGTAHFNSIPYDREGTYVYTITEVNNGGSYIYDSSEWTLTVTVTRNAKTGKLEASKQYSKSGVEAANIAKFTNTSIGSFSVTKTVEGVKTDANFSITVTAVGNSALSGTYGDMTFVDGKATFTLKNGESKTANGVPTGTYTVEEDTSTAAVPGYRLSAESKTHETVAVGVGGDAAVKIVNSYEPNPGTLVVSKTVTGSGNPDTEFNFTVTLSDASVNGDRGEMTFKDGVATFTLKNGEKKTASNLPAGTNYTVVETEANTGGYVTSYNGVAGAENASGTIETERVSNVAVRNHRPAGNLSIEKKVVGGGDAGAKQDYSFEVTGPIGTDESKTYKVEITGNGKQELKGLVPGKYTITEVNADIENYTLKVTTGEGEAAVEGSSVTVEVSAGETAKAEVIFTNTYTSALGSLTIKKTVVGGGAEAANKDFTFTVTGPSYPEGHDVTITGSGTATLENLIPGTYTVTEKDGDVKGYDLEVTGDGEAEITADKVTEINVTNTYTQKLGDLKLTKTVVGGGEEAAAKTYTFKVTGQNGYSKEVEINGSGSETLTDLVPGVYTVTEVRDGTEVNGYDLAVTGENDVTVEAEKTAEITITNTYTQKLGKLTVVKSLVGGGDEAKAKTYTFTVTGPNGYSNTVTITGSGTATLEDIVPGVYTVSEENAAIEGYSLEVTGGGNATVEAEKTATVAVVNTYKPELGSLTVAKVVVGGGEEAANKAYTFAVSGPNGYSDTVTITGNGTATLDNLVPGAYTVTEENAGITGYTWAVSGDNGVTVESDKTATATVVNTYEPIRGSLTIRKAVNAPVTEPAPDPAIAPGEIASGTVIPAVPAYFNVRVAGADGNTGGYDVVHTVPANGSITIEGLVPGLYTVTEVDAGVPGLAWSATGVGDVTVVGGSGAEVTITNNYTIPSPEVGTLIISKAIFGAEEKALNKTFVFDVTGSNGYTNTVTVTGAGSAVLTDLEPAVYTVTERNADIEGYTWSVSVSGEGNVTVGGTAEVTVTNSYTELPKGSLTVNKTVIGGGAEAENKVYAFNVTGPNGYSNTVTVTGTGSVIITDLEPGTYTVTEVREGTEIEGYTLSITGGGTAAVGYGTASDVNVTNNYTENPKGSLRITKTVTGNTEAAEGKVFIFDIAGPEGYTDTVTAAAGGSVTVSDLKPGTYTVTERSSEIEGYTLEVTGEGDYPVGTEEVEAAINNNYTEIPKGSLTVTKTVTGDTEAAEGKVFIFDIAGPDGYTDAVTAAAGESVTVADLEPGTYTVTEQSGEIEGYTLEVTGEGDYTVGAEELGIEIVNNYTKILKGSLVINKEVVGGGEEAANKTYTFDVTGPEGYSTTVTVTGSGSAVLTDLTLGEYTVTEQNAEIEGCTLEVTGSGTVTVEGNENAEITVTNTYTETPKGSLVISKEVVGGGSEASEKTYTFEVTGPNGYSAEVTVIGNGSATLNSLEPGIYTVSEKDAAIEGYTLEVAGEGETEVIANENAAVTITNTYEQIVGSMTITKSVVGGGDEAANKIYTFVITGPNDYSNTVTVIGSGSVTVEGLVPGEYTVTEQNAEIEGYRLTVDGTETATVVADENVDVTITNSYDLIVGSLTITKSVVGGPEDAANREYTFLVTGPDGYAATVTVTGNGSATLEGLVPGEYTVTEQNAEIEGYSLTVDGEAAVTVIADQNIDITITNNYELLLGSLTLTKAITGGGEGAANRSYTFAVTGPEGYSNTVNIIGSGSVTLTDLIPGEYIVTEQNAEISGYRWNVSGEGAVTAVGGEGVQLTVTNTYDELRDINVYKEWYVNGSRTSAPYGAQITVVLLADGEATGDRLTLSEGSNWSGAFTGLPVNAEDGHEIVYTVAEVYYAGWTSSVSGSADAGFVITNYTAIPEIPNIPNVPDNPYTPPTTPENPDVPYFPNNTFDIPDFGTPLSDIPDAEPPLTDIPDIDVPLDAFPATGDESRTYLWFAVMLFSGLGIIVLIAMLIADGRKSGENSESAE